MAYNGLNSYKQYLESLRSRIISISEKLAYRKSQRVFLDTVQHLNLCSSIRPKIGKIFSSPEFESLKKQYLEECRLKIAAVSLQEADSGIKNMKREFQRFFQFL